MVAQEGRVSRHEPSRLLDLLTGDHGLRPREVVVDLGSVLGAGAAPDIEDAANRRAFYRHQSGDRTCRSGTPTATPVFAVREHIHAGVALQLQGLEDAGVLDLAQSSLVDLAFRELG